MSQRLTQLDESLSQSQIQEHLHNDKLHDAEKLINFKQLQESYSNITEYNLPFSTQHVEDVIFVGKKKLIALEYIFYERDPGHKFSKLKRLPKIDDHKGQETYMTFQQVPTEFIPSSQNYLDQRAMGSLTKTNTNNKATDRKDDVKFMKIGGEEEQSNMAEAIVSIWAINKQGHLQKTKQVSFDYDAPYAQSRNNVMRLQLSQDLAYVSLALVKDSKSEDDEEDTKAVHIMAWSTKDLKPLQIKPMLQNNLTLRGQLLEATIIGDSNYLLLTERLQYSTYYRIFSLQTASLVFDYENFMGKAPKQGEQQTSIYCIGLLFHRKVESFNLDLEADDASSLESETLSNEDGQEELDFSDQEQDHGRDQQRGSSIFENIMKSTNRMHIQTAINAESGVSESAIEEHDEYDLHTDSDIENDQNEGGEESINLMMSAFFASDIWESPNDTEQNWHAVRLDIDLETRQTKYKFNFKEDMKKDAIKQFEKKDQLYKLPKNWIINEKGVIQKYLDDISITCNRKLTNYGFLNQKMKYFIAYAESRQQGTVQAFDEYKFTNQNHVKASLGRNQQTKDNLFLHIAFGSDIWAHIFHDVPINQQLVKRNSINLDKNSQKQKSQEKTGSYKYTFKQSDKLAEASQDAIFDYKTDVIQGVTLSKTKQVQMKTAIKQELSNKTFTWNNVRRVSQEQRVQTSFPVIAYNLGMRKIVFQLTVSDQLAMIYELPRTEKFIDFLQFNSIQDLKFDPGKTNLEVCSYILFLTQKKQKFIVNLMIIDPYLSIKGFMLFQTTHGFDKNAKTLRQDEIKNSIIYITQGIGGADGVDIRILVQYFDKMEYLLMNVIKGDDYDDESDDRLSEGGSHGTILDSNPELEEELKNLRYEPVRAILSDKGDVYYVTNYDGQCTVWEINHRLTENEPVKVYEIRTSKCLGFCYYEGIFYLVDDAFVINKLEQNFETRQFDNTYDLYMKERDKPNFNTVHFGTTIIREKYMIHNSHIFYLYKQQPYTDGILDMEELFQSQDLDENESEKHLILGAIDINGSQQFMLMFQDGNQPSFKLRVYQMPDSMYITLIRDRKNKVDLATYLDDGQVFLKMGARYMLFDQNGQYKREIRFNNQSQDKQKERGQKIVKNTLSDKISKILQHSQTAHHQHLGKRRTSMMLGVTQMTQTTNLKLQYDMSLQDQMCLVAISDNSAYYLFEDSAKQTMSVYQLKGQHSHRRSKFGSQTSNNDTSDVEFEHLYKIDWKSSKVVTSDIIYEHSDMSEQQIKSYEDLHNAIKDGYIVPSVDNKSNVTLFFCEEPEKIEFEECTFVNVMGAKFFNPTNKLEGEPLLWEFWQRVFFPMFPFEDVNKIIQEQRKRCENQMAVEQANQDRLLDKFKNNTKMNLLKQKQKMIDHRNKRKYKVDVIGRYIVVQCGRLIKITDYENDCDEEHPLYQGDNDEAMPFRLLDTNLSHQIEIVKILSIDFQEVDNSDYNLSDDLIQIVCKDNNQNILIIITWDCVNNREYSMFQAKGSLNTYPENYVVRGMNGKLNYFMDEHHIYDLEYQIPQQRVNNKLTGIGIDHEYVNQRKIFWNNTRNLSVEYPNTMYIPMTRMDITFWKNIVDKNSDPHIIADNIDFRQLNNVFDGHSLFHYFATNQEVIQMFHEKYLELRDDDDVEKEVFNTPLMLLHPDMSGNSALDIAINHDRPVCFELFIDMLENFQNNCLSKMLLNSFPYMILQGSEIMSKFFNSCNYQPETLRANIRIPWPYELQETIFASHTVLITEDILINEISNDLKFWQSKKYIADTQKWLQKANDVKQNQKKSAQQSMSQSVSMHLDGLLSKNFKQKIQREKAQYIREQYLNDDIDSKKEEAQVRRIEVQCLDFDWIFNEAVVDGEVKNNTLTLIKILSDDDVSNKLYRQSSLRIFIKFLWSEYRPRIIKQQLVPFLIYLVVQNFMTLTGSEVIDNIEKYENVKDQPQVEYYLHYIIIVCLIYSELNWCRTTYTELKELGRDGFGYFKDMWNYLDFSLTILSQVYMIQFMTNMILNEAIFKVTRIRTLGGMTLFLLWIKMFYWMRLFSQTAYFIKLIQATLSDLKQFFNIIIIIMAAFVTIFYVFSCNNEKYLGLDGATGNRLADSVITVYLIMVGEFAYKNFSERPNNILIWPMFLVCNFLMACIFLNMLVAIMMKTFSEVNSHKIESDLEQKLALMSDYQDLFDLNEVFKTKKYIIYVKPAITITQKEVDYVEELEDVGQRITKSFQRRYDEAERNNRLVLKNQNSKITQIQRAVFNIMSTLELKDQKTKQ